MTGKHRDSYIIHVFYTASNETSCLWLIVLFELLVHNVSKSRDIPMRSNLSFQYLTLLG